MATTATQMRPEPALPILAVTGLNKHFGGTQALRSVDFTVERGEVHALLGANGAGKSTLIKILSGLYPSDSGDIRLNGETLKPGDPRIAFVHQDLGLIESMSVGENMAMGYGYPRRGLLIDWRKVDAEAEKALDFLGSPLPLDRPVSELSRAEKSIVAIARALSRKAELLVLDEPTASLPEADVTRLFRIIARLKANNVSVIYVSHRLDEVFRIGDAVTVLRDGRAIAVHRPLDISPEQLVKEIVGGTPVTRTRARAAAPGAPALVVKDFRVSLFGPVSFEVGAGEIVGLAGLRGQGHEATGRGLAGVLPRTSGTVTVGGRLRQLRSPAEAIAAGIGFATGKRAEEALAPTMTVKENLYLNPLNFGATSFGFRSRTEERKSAGEILHRFDVRPPQPERDINTLSGGNQQKVVIARWVGQNYKVLVLEDPTIGVDVGAKAQIYKMLADDAAANGTAFVVVSSDLDEMVQLCDRVLAFSRGRIVAELTRAEISVEALTRAVGGIAEARGAAA
ncbi:MAG TPA: sugar ABC transporter ATP-binding protein [Bauldia sp.]|nr:sugar ABC transporter ATP-binding protein [Bauldia sp.]